MSSQKRSFEGEAIEEKQKSFSWIEWDAALHRDSHRHRDAGTIVRQAYGDSTALSYI